ncbi:MAG: hypothetical protein EG825_10290 [Rhodocyclaceae bacterium]|nr:hypothetical protein [Rhodocyclaceae bacterium]
MKLIPGPGQPLEQARAGGMDADSIDTGELFFRYRQDGGRNLYTRAIRPGGNNDALDASRDYFGSQDIRPHHSTAG